MWLNRAVDSGLFLQLLPPFLGSLHLPAPAVSDFRRLRRLPERSISSKPLTSAKTQVIRSASPGKMPLGIEEENVAEYASHSKLLKEFNDIPSIDKAWTFKSGDGDGSSVMFLIGQPNLLENKKRTFILSSHISKKMNSTVSSNWSPFPIELSGASAIVPSPSGSKLLIVKNKENDLPTSLEIWGPSQLEKEWKIPQTMHGSVYTDAWFEGISWNHDEDMIAYVAEEPCRPRPTFNHLGLKIDDSSEKDCSSWKGQGDWEEDWGETYSGKRKPTLFVLDTNSGEVRVVEGIDESLSVGQVVWAPHSLNAPDKYLVFVGWAPGDCGGKSLRKLGMKYCYNRSCALYAVKASAQKSATNKSEINSTSFSVMAIKLTSGTNSAFFPRFSPDGKYLVFLSAKSSVDSGAHSATNSLHRMDWPSDGKPCSSGNVADVIPVVKHAENGGFPGLYCPFILYNPWLPDGHTMVLCSFWGSRQVILSVDTLSYKISNITPEDSIYSWNILAVDIDKIIAVCSSPTDPPQIKYGCPAGLSGENVDWDWLDIPSPLSHCSEKVKAMLSTHQSCIMRIPVDNSDTLSKGAQMPMEAIFVSSSSSEPKQPSQGIQKNESLSPLIAVIHGGPHSVSLTSYSKSLAFLASMGFNLLVINYRGSLGFGEEALQSLPGNIGSQDVGDVLKAIDHVIEKKLADPSKIFVLGGSHGGFLTTHLIGQAPERFAAAAVRNPVCNLSLMVGTTDIPDWCYAETYGKGGQDLFTEAPSIHQLADMYSKSPISHISKVKTPILFLIGAQDLRVPFTNGLQYARALKERGAEVKVIVFPNDVHSIDRPQSDFESFINIGVWFKKYCK